MPINTNPISPADALNILKAISLMPNPPSVMLHGAPGIGKSEIVAQLAKWRAEQAGLSIVRSSTDLKDGTMLFSDIRLTTIEAQDLRGLPYPNRNEGTVTYLRPSFLPPMDDLPHVVFTDELTAAEQRLQASAYQLLLDRRVGDHALGPNVMVIAAGNSAEHGAISNEMGTAIADRLIHLNVIATPEAWINWAKDNDIAPEVIAFIQTRPDFLDMCEKRVKNNMTIAASPRGWARVSKVLKAFKASGQPAAALEHTVSGIVGQEAAGEFFLVLEEMKEAVDVQRLMDMDDKERRKNLPKKLTSLYGLTYALLPMIRDAKSIESCFEILLAIKETPIKDVPNEEIATLGFEMAISRGEKLGLMKEMIASKAYKRYAEIRRQQGLQ